MVPDDFTYSILVNDVTRTMQTRDQVTAFFPYRVFGTDIATSETFERVEVKRYIFKDGRIAEKDVFSRPPFRRPKQFYEQYVGY